MRCMGGRRDLWLGLGLSAAAVVVVVALGEAVYTQGGSRFEDDVFRHVLNLRAPWLTRIMQAATLLGDPRVLLALVLACALTGWPSRLLSSRLSLPLLLLAVGLANLGLKAWFDRPRPGADFHPLVEEPYSSYPSGHSMVAFVIYGYLAWLALGVPLPRRTRWGLAVLLWLAVLLVGLSRVYLGAHHPGDVLGGYAAGIPLLLAAVALTRR